MIIYILIKKYKDDVKNQKTKIKLYLKKTTLMDYVVSNVCTLNTIKQKGVQKMFLAVFEPYPMVWQALAQTAVLLSSIYHCACQ